MSYRIFLDESGNTGRIRDDEQPVFSVGAVWVPPSRLAALPEQVRELKHRFKVQQPELKGWALLKRPSGRSFLTALFNVLMDERLPVSVVIVQKAFMSAGIFVEDATDYVFNDRFDESWTWPNDGKRDLVAFLIEKVPATTLDEFQRQRSCPVPEDFSRCAERVARMVAIAAQGTKLEPIANKLRFTDWPRVYDAANSISTRHSPNGTAFIEFLYKAQEAALSLGAVGCRLVHDEQPEFASELEFWHSALSRAGRSDAPGRRLPTDRVGSLEFCRSHQEPMLQVADCIAASARALVERQLDDEQLAGVVRELAYANGSGEFPFAVGAEPFLLDALGRLLPARAQPSLAQ